MAYTRLRYHIVLPTRRRARLITPDCEQMLYPMLVGIARELGSRIILLGGVEDHIHIVAAVPPRLALCDFIGPLKTRSSKRMGPSFYWSAEYGALTVDPYKMHRLLAYVRNQKHHHRRGTVSNRFERTDYRL